MTLLMAYVGIVIIYYFLSDMTYDFSFLFHVLGVESCIFKLLLMCF